VTVDDDLEKPVHSKEGERIFEKIKGEKSLTLEEYKSFKGENEITLLIEKDLKHTQGRSVEWYKVVKPEEYKKIYEFCIDEGIETVAWVSGKMKFLKIKNRMSVDRDRYISDYRTILIGSRTSFVDKLKTAIIEEEEYGRKPLSDKDK